jgi:dUTP pyrophosphatase
VHNDSDCERIINAGDRIAQVIFQEHPVVTFDITNELDETERGEGGFGSTGKN